MRLGSLSSVASYLIAMQFLCAVNEAYIHCALSLQQFIATFQLLFILLYLTYKKVMSWRTSLERLHVKKLR
jgi:hypothetical protein